MYQKFVSLLKERNITPYRVSIETGVSETVLSYWKTGRSKPKVDKLQILANYFGVPLEYFLTEEETKPCTKTTTAKKSQ